MDRKILEQKQSTFNLHTHKIGYSIAINLLRLVAL